MSLTTNLSLILTGADEVSMTFLEWRTLMNGVGSNSNMELIDKAIGELIENSKKKADGFKFDPNTGVLSLTSDGSVLSGASVTINLNNYYTKTEVDELLSTLEDNLAGNDAIQDIRSNAIGDADWVEDTRTLTLYNMNGEPTKELTIEGGGGGGGGGTAYSVRIINGMSSTSLTSASSSQTILNAMFYEYYGTDSTGQSGILNVDYKLSTDAEWTSLRAGQVVAQGVSFAIDVTDILVVGKTTNVRLTVKGGESDIERTMTYNIACVEASISAVNFDSTAVYTGNVNFQYKCMGRNLEKTVYFYIDGELYASTDIGTSHNETKTQQIVMVGNYSYGAHTLVVYFETPDGARSNVLKMPILYNDGSSTQPMIGVTLEAEEITYGDTLIVNYVAYTPNQETTDSVSIRVYGMNGDERVNYFATTQNDVTNNVMNTLPITAYPESGTAYVELISGETAVTVTVLVNEIQTEYDIEPITTNLVYHYSPSGKSNNDAGKELYEYEYTTVNGVKTKIKGTFDGMNWVSDGYVDGKSLTLNGTSRHTIKLPIFSTSYTDDDGQTVSLESAGNATVTTNGRTIEVDFMVSSVTDQNAPVIKCMNEDHTGFIITPQVCYLLSSNGVNVELDETGFIENEESIPAAYIKEEKRVRVSFVIEPVDTVNNRQCVNIYINGEFANSQPYDADTVYRSDEFITFGDDSCVMNIYDVRIYNRGLSTNEVRQNYMTAPISVQDKITRLEDNDVMTDDGDVSYEKARTKYPCLLIIGELSPYKGAKKKCGAILTKPDGNGGYVTEFALLDKNEKGEYVCETNVQGTSSQKFMRKNYKLSMKKLSYLSDGTPEIEIGSDGQPTGKYVTKKVKYSLKGKDSEGNDLSIGESTLCYKIDYMSTDHANTFNANLADTLYADKTMSQQEDARVQNTIYGFRCLLFNTDAATYPNGTIYFAGDGALNNDKGNTKTFGLECEGDSGNVTKRQKWEFLNNTNAICFFKTDKLLKVIDSEATILNKEVVNALECTYPDQGDLEDEGLEPNYDYIQVLYTWVCQRANFWDASTETVTVPYTYNGQKYYTEREYRKAIYLNEFDRHLNRAHALDYYLFTEFVALCDNRAKNMFMRCEDLTAEHLVFTDPSVTKLSDIIDPATGDVDASKIDWENSEFAIWITDLYDLDSCFGAENSGYIRIPYYADWDYTLRGANQFNGYDSTFWLMFQEAMYSDIMAEAQRLTREELLCYESLYKTHITENAELVCPAIVNRDMEYKYSDPWTDGFYDYSVSTSNPTWTQTKAYKYLQRGSRTEQKAAFIYRRSHMLYSRYQCDQYRNNNINFRAGQNVEPENSSITMEATQAMYFGVKYGDTGNNIIASGKVAAGIPATITSTQRIGRSDTVYIYGGTDLTDIGDISAFKPYEIQLSKATKIKKLTIGSGADGYTNTSLSGIDLSACGLLEEINLMGCTGLTNTIDMTSNVLIRRIYAGNSIIPYIKLPNGGVLETLNVGTVSNLTVLNMTGLTSFSYDSLDKLTCLRIENTPNIPVMDIVKERLSYLKDGLRLIGIDIDLGDDTSVLEMLLSDSAKGKYLDNNGFLSNDKTAYPQITGVVHCTAIGSKTLEMLNAAYPNLTIDYSNIVEQYEVKFVNYDNTVLDIQYVALGGAAVDPVTRENNPIATPTRPMTVSTIYTYKGWDSKFNMITGATTIMATYSETTREYTVRWYNGTTLLQSKTSLYGGSVEYDGETPTDTSMEQYLTYRLFDGWDNSTAYVNGDIDVHAKFTQATAPKKSSGKTLADLTPVELHAMVQTGVLASNGGYNATSSNTDYYGMISSGDEFDLRLGHDVDFDNVESTEVVPLSSPRTFNGTDYFDTGIKLFDEDKSFVVAIDFAFASTASGGVLASCAVSDNGFKLQYGGSGGVVNFGGTASSAVSSTLAREMLVIRKRKGDTNLYVYASKKSSNSTMYQKITRTLATQHESTLAFGCEWDANDEYASNYTKGTIYWAKVWMDDLGDTQCKHLAQWPRELQTVQAAGESDYSFRLFQKTGTSSYAACCFLLKNLMSVSHNMNASNVNEGGWASSAMRSWLNTRILEAIPDQWRLILQKVDVKSTAGNMSTTEFVTSEDYLWLPSCKEVNINVSSAGYSGESNGTINLFPDNASRIKYMKNGEGAAGNWWLRSPSTGSTTNFHYVGPDGSGSGSGASNTLGVCFGFCI